MKFNERMAEFHKEGVPTKNFIQKWEESNKQSRALAIKANCMECVGCSKDSVVPRYRSSIRECDITSCVFHQFRPYK